MANTHATRGNSGHTTPQTDEPRCTNCLEPATHRGPYGWTFCERCAIRDSAHTRGEAFAACSMIPALVNVCRAAGMSRTEILEATRVAIDDGEPLALEAHMPHWAIGAFTEDTRFAPLADREETS